MQDMVVTFKGAQNLLVTGEIQVKIAVRGRKPQKEH